MDNMEFNKIFAALLIAGIIASLSGFVSKKLVHPHDLEENAVKIDAPEDLGAAGAVKKEKKPEPVLELIASADVGRGEKLSRACAACHSFDKGGVNGVGPNLWDVVNTKKQAKPGYAYSGVLNAQGEENWTYASLNKYLWKPKWYAPGTKMNYIGLKKPEDRAAIIAWMRTLSDSTPALPGEAEIQAEKEALGIVEEEAAAPAAEDEAEAETETSLTEETEAEEQSESSEDGDTPEQEKS